MVFRFARCSLLVAIIHVTTNIWWSNQLVLFMIAAFYSQQMHGGNCLFASCYWQRNFPLQLLKQHSDIEFVCVEQPVNFLSSAFHRSAYHRLMLCYFWTGHNAVAVYRVTCIHLYCYVCYLSVLFSFSLVCCLIMLSQFLRHSAHEHFKQPYLFPF